MPNHGPAEESSAAPSVPGVMVQAGCAPAFITGLVPDGGLGRIVRTSHMSETLQHIAGRDSGDVTLAIVPPQRIVGYLLIDRTEPVVWQGRTSHERWEQCQAIWVLGSIEVSEAYRGQRLATRMLTAAFAEGRYQDRIVVAEGVRWHWVWRASARQPWSTGSGW